jgi:hypothetical protein
LKGKTEINKQKNTAMQQRTTKKQQNKIRKKSEIPQCNKGQQRNNRINSDYPNAPKNNEKDKMKRHKRNWQTKKTYCNTPQDKKEAIK